MKKNDNLSNAVKVFVNILESENKKNIDRAAIDSKLLYVYLEMPKAKRKDMERLVPVIYQVEPEEVKTALYKHYKIK